jgi:3-hydroxy-9,10-secoandrosta-1,3,5(10)-triene-9,17-dione monooxygenase reductase component
MTEDARNLPGEQLRRAMRHWVTGVAIVASAHEGVQHGMTVNSFVSVSLEPPMVTVTLANDTRTHQLVRESGWFGVTILNAEQQHLAEVFAGRVPDGGNRFAGVPTYTLLSGAPLIEDGLAGLDCRVVYRHVMPRSTLFLARVEGVRVSEGGQPLVYHNRTWFTLK